MKFIDFVIIAIYFLVSFIVVEKLAPYWINKNKDLIQPNLKQIIQYRFPFFCLVPFLAVTYKDRYKFVRLFGYFASLATGPIFFLISYVFLYGSGYFIYYTTINIYKKIKDI